MNTTTVSLTNARSLIGAVVEKFGPDYKSGEPAGNGCRYFVDPTALLLEPVCIVGQLFFGMGIGRALLTVDDYGNVVDQEGACIIDNVLWDNAERMGVEFTNDAKRYLRAAQEHQDGGGEWGGCDEAALRSMVREAAGKEAEKFGLCAWEVESRVYNLPEPVQEYEPQDDGLADWERELLGDSPL